MDMSDNMRSFEISSRRKAGHDAHMMHRLFGEQITVSHVLESLATCTDDDDAVSTANFMKRMKFDVLGIRRNETEAAYGYVHRSELGEGRCRDFSRTFHPHELVSESTPIVEMIRVLKKMKRMFVVVGSNVCGIVTRADLQKQTVRLFLFGLIALLEIHLLNLVREFFPRDSWKGLLSESRVRLAERLYQNRQQRNEEVDLADCLQLCDKNKIVISSEETRRILALESKTYGKKLFEDVVKLRNLLVHCQDLVSGSSWERLIGLVEKIEFMIERCEEHGG